jgi:hypothetical protein
VPRRPRPCPKTKFFAGVGKSKERCVAEKLLCG